jgi:hypothetical protein
MGAADEARAERTRDTSAWVGKGAPEPAEAARAVPMAAASVRLASRTGRAVVIARSSERLWPT